ncbi:ATP-dependent Clp protease proteolytic subunit-like [Amaranthus tricolor]|uniref:ATP-dependent Clp protease proteolytic subunit-like n=1 Tax=Amaranthus tricolor TaxID=29722 RepID=UPI0025892238|nr:ATP-dependent Clp protease proteolytic subunit-like [Amaranthus tricolor]
MLNFLTDLDLVNSRFSLCSAENESEFDTIVICNAKKCLVMIHQPASSLYEAQTGEFILKAEELLKLRETLIRVYVQRTGKPLWVVSEDMKRDVFYVSNRSPSS